MRGGGLNPFTAALPILSAYEEELFTSDELPLDEVTLKFEVLLAELGLLKLTPDP